MNDNYVGVTRFVKTQFRGLKRLILYCETKLRLGDDHPYNPFVYVADCILNANKEANNDNSKNSISNSNTTAASAVVVVPKKAATDGISSDTPNVNPMNSSLRITPFIPGLATNYNSGVGGSGGGSGSGPYGSGVGQGMQGKPQGPGQGYGNMPDYNRFGPGPSQGVKPKPISGMGRGGFQPPTPNQYDTISPRNFNNSNMNNNSNADYDNYDRRYDDMNGGPLSARGGNQVCYGLFRLFDDQ